MYPRLGSYESAYPQPAYPPPGWYPPPMQGYGGGGFDNGQMISLLVSMIVTLPGLRAGATTATALSTALAAIVPPPALLGGNPTIVDYNALLDYTNKIRTAVVNTLNNDGITFDKVRQGQLFQALFSTIGQGGGGFGGNNSMMVLMMALVLGGGF